MKTKTILSIMVFGLMVLAQVAITAPLGTAFTYQGHLYDANYAANGLYDFQFKLYDSDSDGNQVGGDVNIPDVDVINAQFTVELDFSNGVFDGDARWLEISVRPGDQNDPCAYTILEPRQEVTPAPYALYARTAQTAGSDGDWMVSGNNMYSIPSGNVGIGTTDPGSAKLKISGGVLDMNSQQIINVADPTSNQDAATKKYVDDNVGIPSLKTYDSGWFAISSGQNISKTHDLGTTKVLTRVYGATSSTGENMGTMKPTEGETPLVSQITTTTCVLHVGIDVGRVWDGSSYVVPTHARIIMLALE